MLPFNVFWGNMQMPPDTRRFGIFVLLLSVVLLAALAFVKMQTDAESSAFCEKTCSGAGQACEVGSYSMHSDTMSWLYLVAFGVGFLLSGAGIYFSFMGKVQPRGMETVFEPIDTSKLTVDEKNIYGIIRENKGSVLQAQIVSKTGLSKVRVTRILDGMEASGIIERKRRGMTNLIVLR